MRLLERQEIEDIARGSAVLGTGGGGDPYLGKLAAIQAMKRFGPLQNLVSTEYVGCPGWREGAAVFPAQSTAGLLPAYAVALSLRTTS